MNLIRTKQTGWLLCLFLVYVSCAPKINPSKAMVNQVSATASSSLSPLMIGMEANPLMRIRIYVPPGLADVKVNTIRCTINADAVNWVQALQVYDRGIEPSFNPANKAHTFTPAASAFDIPVDLSFGPGLHYVWLGATLKETADMDGIINFYVNELVSSSGNTINVSQENTSFKKRVGIAVRKAGDDNVHTYRIPGIMTTDKGTLISVYDIRYKHSGDLPANIDVGMSRSTDGGRTWQPMKIIMDMGAPHENNGVGDPSVLFDPVTKKIWVAALWSKGNRSIAGSEPGLSPDTTGQFVLVSSDDDGLTWSQPYSITSQVKDPNWHLYFNGPGNGIAMQDGTLVFPSQYWDESKKPGIPHSSVIYSKDHGKTWQSGVGAKSNTTESQVVETTPGTLMLNMRDNRGKFRSVSTTPDLGKTWVEHFTSYKALIDPVCMASIIKATVDADGNNKDILFFSNVHSQRGRFDMSIRASTDLGNSWPESRVLLIDERECYGYSCLTKIDDHTIGILYEGIRNLYFVRVPVKDILNP